jgi:MFS transporter, DHA1 family, multidrug resistance protein
LPFATGFFLCTLASLAVVLVVEKGRLFRPHGGQPVAAPAPKP